MPEMADFANDDITELDNIGIPQEAQEAEDMLKRMKEENKLNQTEPTKVEVTGEKSVFETLNAIDVSEYVKEINNRSFLPWSDAWNILKSYYPLATKEQTKFLYADGTEHPYMKTDTGYYVEISVTVEGETETEIYPVMEPMKGKGYVAITEPDAIQINKAGRRGLVKAIASHGLGLYLFQGEDLPVDVMFELPCENLPVEPEPKPKVQSVEFKEPMLSDYQSQLIKAALTLEDKTINDVTKAHLQKYFQTDDLLALVKQDPPKISAAMATKLLAHWAEDKVEPE